VLSIVLEVHVFQFSPQEQLVRPAGVFNIGVMPADFGTGVMTGPALTKS
jgi:hypothetical protein